MADTALVAQALVAHGAVAMVLRLAGLRGVTAWLAGASRGGTTAVPRQTEDRIVWAVRTATRLLPAGRTCLTEALTAQYLVRRHGGDAELRIGVTRAATLQGHAWLETAGRIIIGGEKSADYTPLPFHLAGRPVSTHQDDHRVDRKGAAMRHS